MVADATYFSKIQRFEELYDDRVAAALSVLASDTKAAAEIERSHDVIKSALQELIGLYQALYVTKSSTQLKDDSMRLTRLEANITMTTQQNLEAMQKLVRFSSGSSRLTGPLRSRLLLRSMRKMNTSLGRAATTPPRFRCWWRSSRCCVPDETREDLGHPDRVDRSAPAGIRVAALPGSQ